MAQLHETPLGATVKVAARTASWNMK